MRINDTPYIIVDNQKIQPINRSSRPEHVTVGQPQEHTFGVIDRVTLSREGVERSRRFYHEAASQSSSPNLIDESENLDRPMLTYSPKVQP